MINTCKSYLSKFCTEISERSVGSEGNRQATRRFREIVESFNWKVGSTGFQALDWNENGADLSIGNLVIEVNPSPYSLGCEVEADLEAAATIEELELLECSGKLLLIHGELAKEQLMPKNFVFYNPKEHQRIITQLEKKNPAAILCATPRNPALAGGVYPFPLIEDGDFDIPSVYMTEEKGKKLILEIGKPGRLVSRARRVVDNGYQLIARKGKHSSHRIAISAHIDAKKGTPGAIDNATGVIILLLLAELLQDYSGNPIIELIPFNGEDYFAVPGQMIYLDMNRNRWGEIRLNINIDGAGYNQGLSAFSFFNLSPEIKTDVQEILDRYDGIREGKQWVQGDHSIFIQQGVPAIAVSSQWFIENIDQQRITHTPADHPGIVECEKLVEIARALADLLQDEMFLAHLIYN